MELGVFGLNAKAVIAPATTAGLARRAEELGYRSWWVGEHVVLPSPRVEPSPMEATDAILDPLVHLAFVAAHTESIELGTGIVVLPQRNPLVLAKQVASLDVLSDGRLLLGVGVGYLEPELRRGRRQHGGAWIAHRRVPGRDACTLDTPSAVVSRAARRIRRGRLAPASRATGGTTHRRRRPPRRVVPARRHARAWLDRRVLDAIGSRP